MEIPLLIEFPKLLSLTFKALHNLIFLFFSCSVLRICLYIPVFSHHFPNVAFSQLMLNHCSYSSLYYRMPSRAYGCWSPTYALCLSLSHHHPRFSQWDLCPTIPNVYNTLNVCYITHHILSCAEVILYMFLFSHPVWKCRFLFLLLNL